MDKATALFTAVPKLHNCAQAVVCGSGREDLYGEMQNAGGGRAEGNRCGALHGALAIIAPEQRSAALEEFKNRLGAESCRELKLAGVPCATCVATAAAIVEKYRSVSNTGSSKKTM